MTITLPEIDHEVDAAIEQLITDLENARDYIDKHGHTKNQYASALTNATCSEGAIIRVVPRGARRWRALYALAATLGADISTVTSAAVSVHRFNDADETEKADVIGLFNTAIDRLRA